MKSNSLFFIEKRQVRLQEEELTPPRPHELLVRTRYSAISGGTEQLIYQGLFPSGMETDTGISALSGEMSFPLKYGYSLIGEVIETGSDVPADYLGKKVFLFHPHQELCKTTLDQLQVIPPGINELDALFFANVETAVSLVMDGRPLVGEKVIVFGQGVVGLLTTAILSQFPLSRLIVVDLIQTRREWALRLGAKIAIDPRQSGFEKNLKDILEEDQENSAVSVSADLIFELSGKPAVLNMALAYTGYHSRLVIGSWYGNQPVKLDLGGNFHRNHVQLMGSQVSTIHPRWRGRWTKHRRYQLVWQLLARIKPSRLITHQFELNQATAAYALLEEKPPDMIQIIFAYPSK